MRAGVRAGARAGVRAGGVGRGVGRGGVRAGAWVGARTKQKRSIRARPPALTPSLDRAPLRPPLFAHPVPAGVHGRRPSCAGRRVHFQEDRRPRPSLDRRTFLRSRVLHTRTRVCCFLNVGRLSVRTRVCAGTAPADGHVRRAAVGHPHGRRGRGGCPRPAAAALLSRRRAARCGARGQRLPRAKLFGGGTPLPDDRHRLDPDPAHGPTGRRRRPCTAACPLTPSDPKNSYNPTLYISLPVPCRPKFIGCPGRRALGRRRRPRRAPDAPATRALRS